MRFATLRHAGEVTSAVVTGDGAFALPDGLTVDALVRLGLDRALEVGERAQRATPFDVMDSTFTKPYTPASFRDFVTFESHVEGVRKSVDGASGVPDAWYDAPTFYFGNSHAIYGPGEVVKPRRTNALDFEMEVGVVLGAGGMDLTVDQAHEAIFGYLIVNDWSARDLQSREMKVGLGPAKGKDFATSIGPWLVTADELDPYVTDAGFLDLACRAVVNDQLIGGDQLSAMNWTFPQMIAFAARDSVVAAGDLLASGTTGSGCLAELWGRSGSQTPPPLAVGRPGRPVCCTGSAFSAPRSSTSRSVLGKRTSSGRAAEAVGLPTARRKPEGPHAERALHRPGGRPGCHSE